MCSAVEGSRARGKAKQRVVVGGKLCLESLQSCDNQTVFEDDCFTNRARDNSSCTVFVCKLLRRAVPPCATVLRVLQSKFMVTAVEIRGYEPLFTEDNRRLCGCLAPLFPSLPRKPRLNTQSCIKRPFCRTFRFENFIFSIL